MSEVVVVGSFNDDDEAVPDGEERKGSLAAHAGG